MQQVLGVPVPDPGDMDRLGEWLAARGLGLVTVEQAAAFAWPGHWIAVTSAGRAVVMFGVPSGPLDDVLEQGETLVAGYVVAPHDLGMERRVDRRRGTVVTLVVAPETAGPAREIDRCRAIAGHGLQGDRYAKGGGTFVSEGRIGQDLTLVDADALDAAGVSPVDARRNVVIRGIDLDALIGRRFRIGTVECRGERRAEPCAHLQRLTRPGLLRSLVHRGGIRADIVTDGEITTGDAVALVDEDAP